MQNRFAHIGKRKSMVLGVVFFLFYAATTAQDVLPADSGEFQLVTALWGIAHPPGYPFYTVLGALWSHLLPLGNIAYRTNLLSAALAAVTLVLTFHAVVQWSIKGQLNRRHAQIGGLASVLLLAAAGTYWAQATIANIRMPTLLFTAWGFSTLADFHKNSAVSARDKTLCKLALIIGLGTGHHPSLLFVVLGWIAYIAINDVKLIWSPRRWWKIIVIASLSWGIPQLYLPIRGVMQDVVLNPGNLATWRGFWSHILARGFSGDMFAFASKTDLMQRLPLLPSLFQIQFPVYTLLVMIAGWIWLLKWQRDLAVTCALSWLIHTYVTITYRAPQTIEYLMPAYIPMAIIFGVTISAFSTKLSFISNRRFIKISRAVIVIILLLAVRFILRISDFSTLAADKHIRARTEPLLTAAPDQAVIFADWRWVTPLWTMQKTEYPASSTRIHYIYPESTKSYDQVWLNRVDNEAARPIFVTHKYDWQEWNFVPVGGGYRLYKRPLMALPDELQYHELEVDLGSIRILGFRINGEIQPGQAIELQLVWQAIQPFTSPPSFTARIWDNEGHRIAASDRFLGTDTSLGEIRFSELTLQLPFDQCFDKIQATVGVYIMDGQGFVDMGTAELANMNMACDFPFFPAVRHWPAYITKQGPVVRGIDYDMITPSSGFIYLHLIGPGKPLTIQSNASTVNIPALQMGDYFTSLLQFTGQDTSLVFMRSNNTSAKIIGLPFPQPNPGERYTPYGEGIILTSSNLKNKNEYDILNLEWLTAHPINEDYVVSARLRPMDDSWQRRHDSQPGLGAIPTLKWTSTKSWILDPHPFQDLPSEAAFFDLTIYEPYRMTPLSSPYGRIASYTLP